MTCKGSGFRKSVAEFDKIERPGSAPLLRERVDTGISAETLCDLGPVESTPADRDGGEPVDMGIDVETLSKVCPAPPMKPGTEFAPGVEFSPMHHRFIEQCCEGLHGERLALIARAGVALTNRVLRKSQSYGGQILNKRRILRPDEKPSESIMSRKSDKIERIASLVSGEAGAKIETLAETMADDAGYSLLWLVANLLEEGGAE